MNEHPKQTGLPTPEESAPAQAERPLTPEAALPPEPGAPVSAQGEARPLRASAGGKKKWSRGRKIRLACILAGVLLLLAAAVWFLWTRVLSVRPQIEEPVKPGTSASPEDEEVITTDGPRVGGVRKTEDFFTILLVGRDTGGGGNTDTMMLFSYNVTGQELNVMSLPRDTMVNVSWSTKKLNSVYNANGGGAEGISALKEEVGALVGFLPDFYVMVEWEAVGELVEAIGGVEFEIPFDMNYDDPAQDLHIHLEAGLTTLNGDQAMQLVRWRKNNSGSGTPTDGSDLSRIKLQQDFMTAVIRECLQIGNLTKIAEFARIFQQYVETDLSLSNLIWFGQSAVLGGLDLDHVNFFTMPCEAVEYPRGVYGSYVVPQPEELLEAVNDCLNPYEADIVMSQLELMYVTSDFRLGVSSGTVEGYSGGGSGTSSPGGGSGSGGGSSPEPSPAVSEEPQPSEGPEPSPTVSGEPQPSEDPEPSPTVSGEPQPSEDPEPSPTVSEEPQPSEGPEPSPTVSGEPQPSGSPEPSPAPAPTEQPADPAPSSSPEGTSLPAEPGGGSGETPAEGEGET